MISDAEPSSYIPLATDVFFEKCVFSSVPILKIGFFVFKFYEFFINFGHEPLIWIHGLQIFFPVGCLCDFCCAIAFKFDVVSLVDSPRPSPFFCAFCFIPIKSLPRQVMRSFFSMFSSNSSVVSGLIFKSLTHF